MTQSSSAITQFDAREPRHRRKLNTPARSEALDGPVKTFSSVHGTYVRTYVRRSQQAGSRRESEFSPRIRGPRTHTHTHVYKRLERGKRADPHESGEWSASNTKRTSVRPADDGGVPYIRYDRTHERERERGARKSRGAEQDGRRAKGSTRRRWNKME